MSIDISRYHLVDVDNMATTWREHERERRAKVKAYGDALEQNVPWISPRPRHMPGENDCFGEDYTAPVNVSLGAAAERLRAKLKTPKLPKRQSSDDRTAIERLATGLAGAKLSDAFAAFDEDGSGQLDLSEFIGAMSRLSIPPHLATDLFHELDDNQNGKVSFKEVAEEIRKKSAELAAAERKRMQDGSLAMRLSQERKNRCVSVKP